MALVVQPESSSCSTSSSSRGGSASAFASSSISSSTELQRAWTRLQAGVVRGAAIGCTLRGGLHLVGALLAAASKRKRRTVTAAAAVEDTLRYIAFLGALAGIYIGVDEGIAAAVGKERSARWRSLAAGVCAGPALLLTGTKNRHNSLATYVLLRGITLLIRVGNKQRNKQRHLWLWRLLAPTRIEHGDTLLMCASCSQILYAFIMMTHTLPPSYVRFIQKQGAKELWVWQAIRELAERTAAGRPRGPLTSLMGTCHADCQDPLPCSFFHPNQTCLQHPLQLLLPATSRALSVYLPVYLLPALLVHRQTLLKTPLPILKKVLLGIARSSLFLSSFICLAFGGACLGHRLTGRTTGLIIAGSTWIGGLATLLEKKSRRMELALYVLSRSLESFSRCMLSWGWLSPRLLPRRMDVLLFAAGAGAILHCYSGSNGVHRDVFKSKYLNVLDFVFGNTGFQQGQIKHNPSNADLLLSVTQTVTVRVRSLSYGNLRAGMGSRPPSIGSGLDTVAERCNSVKPALAAAAVAAAAAAAAGESSTAAAAAEGSAAVAVAAAESSTEAAAAEGSSAASTTAAVAVVAAAAELVSSPHRERRRSSSWPNDSLGERGSDESVARISFEEVTALDVAAASSFVSGADTS